MKLYRNREGEKLYPICSWENNQHKLYNAYDRAMIRCYEEDWSDDACAEKERIEEAMSAFDSCVIEGIVYATWADGEIIKDIIAAYNARH